MHFAFVYHGEPGRPAWGQRRLYHYHTDHLGTPRRASDEAGVLKWYAQEPWDPYELRSISYVSGSSWEHPALRFPGQVAGAWSPFVYNYFRDYYPAYGRYVQSDPIGLTGGLNTYAYANSNPIRQADFYGLWAWRSPTDAWDYWSGFAGGSRDFADSYSDQWRATNTVGGSHNRWANQDVYFHCRANCEAAQRGPGGDDASVCISDAREAWDEFWGQEPKDTARDQAANSIGRLGGALDAAASCQIICGAMRPRGSFPSQW